MVRTDGGAGSPGSGASSEGDVPMSAQETLIGWADVREILREFIVTHTERLNFVSDVSKWDAPLDALAAEFCARKLVNVTGDDGQLLPHLHASMTLAAAVSDGFLSTGSDERTLTPRSGGAALGARGVVHRLALFAGGRIDAILSQSDIMTYLYRHSELLGPELARSSVDALGFASGKRVVCVTPHTPTHAAFAIMYANSVSAVGVVAAGTEELIANLSASDMRRLEPRHFRALALPVAEFLAQASGEPCAGYAPQRGGSFLEFARGAAGVRAPLAIAPQTPFLRVLELLGGHHPRVHRVYITEHGRPIGVVRAPRARRRAYGKRPCADAALCRLLRAHQITPTDVLRFLAVREEQ